jgi:hypothetical protein
MTKIQKCCLVDLPGVRRKRTMAFFVRSQTQAMRIIRAEPKGAAVTAAGGRGAINIWVDDKRLIRCNFQRHCCDLSNETFDSLTAVRGWLREWWPQMVR